ncbi:hypothetical protein KI688_004019 [Linnemannia hyalina]|uniref:F-box domain-containing protein n=1 Tax=Linnemannia hyalina TaxID=64524 RepID=A0A9P7XMG0_9FUNG|nr:hypothetical protein KI688_004019 [Linnemannia hyalina]
MANPASSTNPLQDVHLPAEVIHQIGQSLDGPSLYSALRVSQRWKAALSLNLWTRISALQVQHKELYPNQVPSSNRDLSMSCLGNILRMTKRVKELVIQTRGTESFIEVLQAIRAMERLQVLELQFPHSQTLLPLSPLFECFSKLRELHLRGKWYGLQWQTGYTELGVDQRTEVADGGEKGEGSWQVRTLTVCRADIGIAELCPNLESILIEHVPQDYVQDELPTFQVLADCITLKALEFCPLVDEADMANLETFMGSFAAVETLIGFPLWWSTQAEMLTTGQEQIPEAELEEEDEEDEEDGDADADAEDNETEGIAGPFIVLSNSFAMPKLKELEVTASALTLDQEERFASRLFFQRPMLERLLLPNGMHIPLESLLQADWVCTNLTELQLGIFPPEEEDDFDNMWRSFFLRIGRLAHITILHITTTDMAKEQDCLAGLRHARNLRELTLLDEGLWARAELRSLLTATPALQKLMLSSLSASEHSEVLEWMHEIGKAHILANQP